MYEDLVRLRKLIDEMPREAWMIARPTEGGGWEILERGEAPPGWRELSGQSPLFRIDFHVRLQTGDRVVISEDIYEMAEDGSLVRASGGLAAAVCPTCQGDECVPAVTERDVIYPDMTGPTGEPLMPCPTCGESGGSES